MLIKLKNCRRSKYKWGGGGGGSGSGRSQEGCKQKNQQRDVG